MMDDDYEEDYEEEDGEEINERELQRELWEERKADEAIEEYKIRKAEMEEKGQSNDSIFL